MAKLIFKNYGGSFQLRIQDAEDLKNIQTLDETHWAATSIPIDSLSCDRAFTSYVDTDKNGRIRTDELKAAVNWLFRVLANRSRLPEQTDTLKLGDVDTTHEEGKRLKQAAGLILSNLNSKGASEITLSQVRDVQNIMASAANNGDGIISPDATTDSDLAGFITSVMDTVGSAPDASGKPGINQNQLNMFFSEAEAYLAWSQKGKISKEADSTEIMPWGAKTPEAYNLISGLEPKIDQYFAQCDLVRLDERAASYMKLNEKEFEKIDFTDKQTLEARLRGAPVAAPNPKGVLEFDESVNPAYLVRLADFKDNVLKRALGGSVKQISQGQWQRVKDIFIMHKTWLADKQGRKVEKLGEDRLRAYIDGPYKQRVSDLILSDLSVAGDINQIYNLEKLILCQKWLLELTNNFVNFSRLYDPKCRALFEAGTLIIDSRQITFTMRIKDRQAHKNIAEKSCMYLLYLEITGRRDKDIKFDIVASVTSGEAGRLHTGKRGVFFSTDGTEFDAEVVDIVVNPISIWESIRAPFQQVTEFIRKQVDKFTKSRQGKLEQNLAAPSASGMTRDLLLGGGIALAALGSAFAYITKALSQVKAVHILIALGGLAAIILLPGVIMGFIKIRKRDMSTILEASGWAVNVRMRLNDALGRLFTHSPRLPKGASKERRDLVAKFVKESGFTDADSGGFKVIVLTILIIALGLTLIFFTFPVLRPCF